MCWRPTSKPICQHDKRRRQPSACAHHCWQVFKFCCSAAGMRLRCLLPLHLLYSCYCVMKL